ncbi:MAG: ChbG/HpnK family deacetylase [Betaproteobacteria bacterium]|nr:ChbG/HpnK family deacetylase [Betaproteobacteria bacterium]
MDSPIRPTRRICLTADDFGLHAGVDTAIRELVEARRLQAFGCMVGGRSWRNQITWLRALHKGDADIGLHLDLTEFPLAHPPQGLGRLLAQAYSGQLDERSVRTELRRQLDTFEHALGHAPDYLDGHQHVHQLPCVRDQLMEELGSRYTPGERPWLRCTVPSRGLPMRLRFKAGVIAMLGGRKLRRLATGQGYAMNSALLGVYGFDQPASGYQRLLGHWLSAAPDQALLMCHPATLADSSDPIAQARLAEYQVLASPVFLDLLALNRIETMPMHHVLGLPRSRPSETFRVGP